MKESKFVSSGDTFTYPVCNDCKYHLGGAECAAFKRIPDDILEGRNPHTKPTIRQKNEIVFSPKPKSEMENAIDQLKQVMDEFDESKHPRAPKGSPNGGQWISEEGQYSVSGYSVDKQEVKKAVDAGLDTHAMYTKNGEWTKERAEMHERIITAVMATGKKSNNLIAQIIGGAPANCKSTFLDSKDYVAPDSPVTIDQDHLKTFLPEYKFLTGKKHIKAAAFVHEESSYLAKEIVRRSLQMQTNIMQDSVWDEGYEKNAKKIDALKAAGYKVKMDYVTLDANLSLKLAQDRYEKTGRYVPRSYIRKANKDITDTVIKLGYSGKADEINLWDTNENGKPRLVATAKGGNWSVKSPELWQRFMLKGKGTPRKKKK